MSYICDSLTDNEELLTEGKFHWSYHLASWFVLFTLGWVLIGVYIWMRMQIHFATTEIGVTTQRVLIKRGLFTKQTMELGLESVEQVEVRQSLWGQIFGFGTLEMHGSGEGELHTPPIAHPVAFRRVLSGAVSEARHPRVYAQPSGVFVPEGHDDALYRDGAAVRQVGQPRTHRTASRPPEQDTPARKDPPLSAGTA